MIPRHVAIIGTGLIGRGWAVVFARAGSRVALWDRDPAMSERALAHVRQSIEDLAEAGLVKDSASASAGVSVAASLHEALGEAEWAQESVTERPESKRDVFLEMDKAARSDAILASSASAIPGSVFLSDVPGRERCIVAHPANPPHLMPVVELVPSMWHAAEFVVRCREVLTAVGQVPVTVRKEVAGFVMNRLQAAVIGEAMALVSRGVIDPDDLDAVMKHSLGLRWSFLGPFETMDLNAPAGFLDYATRYGATYAELAADLTVAEPWPDEAVQSVETARRRAVPLEAVGERQRWRDRRLMRLLMHRREVEQQLGS